MAAGLGSLALHAIFPVVDTRGGGQQFSIPPRKCPFNKTLVSVCISICQNQIASTVYKKSKKEQRNFKAGSLLEYRAAPHCKKITQNVAFEYSNYGISQFPPIILPVKIDRSGSTIGPPASVLENWSFLAFF